MAYTPKTWECNEIITANDLNHMEQGIASIEELPTVTSADNGKVLTVVNGEWAKAESGGGTSDVITTDDFIILKGTTESVAIGAMTQVTWTAQQLGVTNPRSELIPIGVAQLRNGGYVWGNGYSGINSGATTYKNSLPKVTTTTSSAYATFFNESENASQAISYIVVFMKLALN